MKEVMDLTQLLKKVYEVRHKCKNCKKEYWQKMPPFGLGTFCPICREFKDPFYIAKGLLPKDFCDEEEGECC